MTVNVTFPFPEKGERQVSRAGNVRRIASYGLILWMSVCAAYGGTHELSGIVLDSLTRSPLIGATVMIVGNVSRTGGFSDQRGQFLFSIPDHGMLTITVRYIGYREKTLTLDFHGDESLTILLAPEAVELLGIEVTGNPDRMRERSNPQSVTILTSDELDMHRGQTLAETLENIHGVSVIRTGPSIAKPVIRGMHGSRLLVLNGGVRQEGQQWGGEHAPEIDPFAPGTVEVLRGPSAIEYGAGAIGGVIKIDPPGLRFVPGFGGSVTLNAFSNSLQGSGSVTLDGSPGFLPGSAFHLQGSYRRAGDASTPDYVIGNSGFEELNGALLAGYRTGGLRSEIYLTHFGTELGIYRGSHVGNYDDLMRAITLGRPPVEYDFTYRIDAPKQRITHDLASIKTSVHWDDGDELQFQVSSQQNRRREYEAHKRWSDTVPAEGPPAFDLELTTYDADLRYRHAPVGRLVGTSGVTVLRQTNAGNSLSFLITNYRLHSAGAFVNEALVLDEATLQAGVRWDWSSLQVFPYAARGIPARTSNRSGFTAAVGVLYPFLQDWSVGANLGTAWRPAAVNELYSNGVHHGTAQYEVGDPDLVGERSLSLDATLRCTTGMVDLEVSGYWNRMIGYIYLFPVPAPTLTLSGMYPTFQYRQADAVLAGIDGTASLQVTEDFRTGITFSLLRGELSASNEPLYQMPSDRLQWMGHMHLPDIGALHGSYVELEAEFVRTQDRFPRGVDYLDPPPGYTLLNVSAGTMIATSGSDLRLVVSVNNLLNTAFRDVLSRFRYFIDEPGRSIALRVHIPFTIVGREHS